MRDPRINRTITHCNETKTPDAVHSRFQTLSGPTPRRIPLVSSKALAPLGWFKDLIPFASTPPAALQPGGGPRHSRARGRGVRIALHGRLAGQGARRARGARGAVRTHLTHSSRGAEWRGLRGRTCRALKSLCRVLFRRSGGLIWGVKKRGRHPRSAPRPASPCLEALKRPQNAAAVLGGSEGDVSRNRGRAVPGCAVQRGP